MTVSTSNLYSYPSTAIYILTHNIWLIYISRYNFLNEDEI